AASKLDALGHSLQADDGRIELAGAFHRGERDREILNREPGRVEDGDVPVRCPSVGTTDEDVTELRHGVTRDRTGLDRVDEISVVTRLLGGLYKQNTLDSAVARTVRSTPR